MFDGVGLIAPMDTMFLSLPTSGDDDEVGKRGDEKKNLESLERARAGVFK